MRHYEQTLKINRCVALVLVADFNATSTCLNKYTPCPGFPRVFWAELPTFRPSWYMWGMSWSDATKKQNLSSISIPCLPLARISALSSTKGHAVTGEENGEQVNTFKNANGYDSYNPRISYYGSTFSSNYLFSENFRRSWSLCTKWTSFQIHVFVRSFLVSNLESLSFDCMRV